MEAKKLNKKIDRIVLDAKTIPVINELISQVQNELGNLVHVNTKVMANFIMQKRSALLSNEELILLKTENLDIIKALKNATQEAIRSRKNGRELSYDDIQKILQTPSVNEKVLTTKPRQCKKKLIGSDSKKNDTISPTEANTETKA